MTMPSAASVVAENPVSLRDRAPVAMGLKQGDEPAVDRDNRVVRGYSVITRGEALGHGFWIDSKALDQVVKLGKAASKKGEGVKSRFTHPDICNDGLGKYLGRTRGFTRDGDQVRGDLYLAEVASESPDGDLAGYVMGLAEEDPGAFAASIVFHHDRKAEADFRQKHLLWDDEYQGKRFTSPDPDNIKNLPHIRLSDLAASDIVDEAAANEGFFGRKSTGSLAVAADNFLSFAFLDGERPAEDAFGLDPDRATTFVHRWLDRHGLRVESDPTKKPNRPALSAEATNSQPPRGEEEHMSEQKEQEAAQQKAAEETAAFREEGSKSERDRFALLKTEFPDHPDFVAEQFEKGSDIEAARSAFKDVQLSELQAENEQLKAGKNSEQTEDAPPVTTGAEAVSFGTPAESSGGKDFLSVGKEHARENKVSLSVALSAVARENPELARAYKEAAVPRRR